MTGVTESGQNVPLLVQLTVESSTINLDIGVRAAEPTHALGCCHQTKEANSCRARAFERRDRSSRTSSSRQHRIEQKEIALRSVARDFEVIVDRLERTVIAIEPDVTDARRGYETENPLDHAKSGAKNRNQREFLSADMPASSCF